jgi:hypothetical protein
MVIEAVRGRFGIPIRIEEIPEAREWLFLNGFRDPLRDHNAFDFSAYETFDGRVKLGIPPTKVYSPFDGLVMGAYDDRLNKWNVFGEPGYGSGLEIFGKVDDFIVTAIFSHVTPLRGLERVNEGDVVGVTFESQNTETGTLGHLHYNLMLASRDFPNQSVDPLQMHFPNVTFRRLSLPHNGPFTRDELIDKGIEIKYSKILDYSL